MISFIPGKTLGGRLVLISAGILLHASGALAENFAGDPQMQASDLLSGTVRGRAKIVDISNASPATPAHGRPASNPDPQEQARRLILGESNSAGTADRAVAFDSKSKSTTVVSVQNIGGTYADGQESAQRMLLGAGS
jgi:hypothetical protein